MTLTAWLLLALLRAHSVASEDLDCTNESRTVAVKLGTWVPGFPRIWQQDGDCSDWQHPIGTWKEQLLMLAPFLPMQAREFSAPRPSVESRLSWLMMQLPSPMVVERVSVRIWGGEWQTAGAVGSRVSAVGAASLPPELQLQDPCRASWDAFGSSERWRQLNETAAEAAVSFILINGTRSAPWTAVNITGRSVPMVLQSYSRESRALSKFVTVRLERALRFEVKSCGAQLPSCSIRFTSGKVQSVARLRSDNHALTSLFGVATDNFTMSGFAQVSFNESEIPQSLVCTLGDSSVVQIEEFIAVEHDSEKLTMAMSPVWVSGRPVFVTVTSFNLFPEPQHRCKIVSESEGCEWWATVQNKTLTVHRNTRNISLVTLETKFKLDASMLMLNSLLECTSKTLFGRPHSSLNFSITDISDPCVTDVDLGPHRHWQEDELTQIRVTSRNCSIWNASHSCWLIDSAPKLTNFTHQLHKIHENSFTSIHQLRVSRWMSERDWSVRCRVNQSGVVYDDVVSNRNQQPRVFYRASIRLASAMIKGAQAEVTVIISDAKPPVSSVTCQIGWASTNANATISLTAVSQPFWSFTGRMSTPVGASQSDTPSIFCTAHQIYENSLIFESQVSGVGNTFPGTNCECQCP